MSPQAGISCSAGDSNLWCASVRECRLSGDAVPLGDCSPAREFAVVSSSGSVAVMDLPQTQYARSGDVSIAYQVLGDGPLGLVFVPPHVSNVELVWEIPPRVAGMRRLRSSVA